MRHQVTCGKHLRAQRVTISRFGGDEGGAGMKGSQGHVIASARDGCGARKKRRDQVEVRGRTMLLSLLLPLRCSWERFICAAGGGGGTGSRKRKRFECIF